MKVFIEQQKFTQLLVIIILSIVIIVAGYSTFKELDQITTGSLTEKLSALSGLIIVLLVVLLFTKLKLKTRIDEKGIYYQFFPFHLSFKFIDWNTISKCKIRNYNPITEYGGWGVKFGLKKKEKAYTTKGNIGLQLVLKNGTKVLIGTQKKEELQRVLDTYQHKIYSHEI